MDEPTKQHPDDRKGGLRIPRRDVKGSKRMDVAHPVEDHVARREHRRIAQIVKSLHSDTRIVRKLALLGKYVQLRTRSSEFRLRHSARSFGPMLGTLEFIGAMLFALAVLHTFSTRYFEHLAHTRTAHAGVWHLLGEVEATCDRVVFVKQGRCIHEMSLKNAQSTLDVEMRVDRTELRTKRVPATKKPNSSNGKRSKRRIADFKSDRWYLAAAQSVSIRQNSSGSS